MFWSQIVCRKRRSGERSTTLPRRFRKAPFVRHAPGRRPVVNVVTLAALARSPFFFATELGSVRHSFASGVGTRYAQGSDKRADPPNISTG